MDAEAAGRLRQHPGAARRRDRAARHRSGADPAHGGARGAPRRGAGHRALGARAPPTGGPRSAAPTSSWSTSRPAGSRRCATTSRSPSATACGSRSATPSGPAGCMRALRNIPVFLDIAPDMEEMCPDAWLLNLTNPMTTICRALTAGDPVEDRRALPRDHHHAVPAQPAARRELPGPHRDRRRREPPAVRHRARRRRRRRVRAPPRRCSPTPTPRAGEPLADGDPRRARVRASTPTGRSGPRATSWRTGG